MFRVSLHDRGQLLEEGIPIIQRALAAVHGGRPPGVRAAVAVQAAPSFCGGGVPAGARRAARPALASTVNPPSSRVPRGM
jgi:hypothetical protein